MTFSLALNYLSDSHLKNIAATFSKFGCKEIFVSAKTPRELPANCKIVSGYGIEFGHSLREVLGNCKSAVLALILKPAELNLLLAFKDWIEKVEKSQAIFHYSTHSFSAKSDSALELQPCIDYQFGSVRDDFDFGPLILLNVAKARDLAAKFPHFLADDASALYGLRLLSSLTALPSRNTTPTYESIPVHQQDAHQAHFAYASSAGAASQKAFEHTFTEFSKIAGFHLSPQNALFDFNKEDFEYEASVIIPVRNRVGKIEHAVQSALSQKTNFKFNVIVVDNHSSDGTTASLEQIAKTDSRLKHIVPERKDLGIGGCWQLAIEHKECGRFAVQLDSDDLYSSVNVLQRIVQEFHETKAAAVVGSYLLVDKDLNEIPPGAIEHREWNDLNGHNNALRINGLGAPRAYFTSIIREVGFPNVSYGEDYFAMLRISGQYKIARIYEHLYLCRRWEGNSDAAPSVEKMNNFHTYKDGLRTAEIELRKARPDCC